ncbi:MAG TPA: RNA degradosome polyphosphate kinase, partial [Pedococcus sp.]|nr:RNA degradosome polyphosphate kinase [Pedococcus sp.]
LVQRHSDVFNDDVLPRLEEAGIRIVRWDQLEEGAALKLREYFRDQVFPVLTPLAVDPAHPFPYISGLSLNLAVMVRDPGGGQSHFARVKVPNNVPRFIPVGPTDSTATFLPLEDLIAAHLNLLFPGLDVLSHHLFRVTRNADMEVEEDRDEDLLQALERELSRRRFGPAVRLEVTESMDPQILEVLLSELEMNPHDVLHVRGLLDLASLWALYDLDRPELKDDPFVPATHPRLSEGETPKSVFATLREGDVLLHHPYHSFATSVQRFIEQAAADPQVLAIKQTLYRTSGDSPIVNALIDAAEAGKQVVVLVEIKARFDEEANITWARSLERAGCHVVYGLVGLKTHCKTALVVRREHGVLRRYCHIGTGNYNPKTARTYEDLGILTADPRVGADLTDLFNTLTGYSRQTNYRTLMVAPHGIRTGLVEKIRREARHAAEGKSCGIRLKMNSLVDERVIDALYEASRAGVPVELLIRGICALRPGVPGVSDTIRVRSIVGRFLEHSRVMSFENGGDREWWLGSADLMHRNLDRRVEVLLRVCDETSRTELQRIFEAAMAPDVRCWELASDGTWARTGEHDYQADLTRRAGEHAG